MDSVTFHLQDNQYVHYEIQLDDHNLDHDSVVFVIWDTQLLIYFNVLNSNSVNHSNNQCERTIGFFKNVDVLLLDHILILLYLSIHDTQFFNHL